jgi:anti-anti-sigma factor
MNTTIEDKDGIMTVVFEGVMDTLSVPEVEETIQPIFTSETKEIIIDCTKLEYISSSGLRVFLCIALDTQSAGKHVCITGMSDFVWNVFATTGLANVFEFK